MIKTALVLLQSSLRLEKIDFIYERAFKFLALGLHIVNLVCSWIQFALYLFRKTGKNILGDRGRL